MTDLQDHCSAAQGFAQTLPQLQKGVQQASEEHSPN